MSTLKRISPLALTLAVTLVFYSAIATLIPTHSLNNLSFWGLWFVGMLLGSLPMLFLEVAYAKRSRNLPLVAMAELTRQADSPKFYRASVWLGFFALSSGTIGLIAEAQIMSESLVMGRVNLGFKLTDPWVLAVLTALVFAVASLRLKVLPLIAAAVAVVALVASGFDLLGDWHLSGVNFWQFGLASGLGLAGGLLGGGLYWQLCLSKQYQSKEPVSIAISWWAVQLVAGVLFALFVGVSTQLSHALMSAAVLLVACCIAPLAYNSMLTRFKSPFTALAWVAAVLVFWSLPLADRLLWTIWLSALLVACGLHAVFAGWNMKISHLRKSLMFDTEFGYSIWRVVIRFAVPLLVIWTLGSYWQLLLPA